MSDNDTRKRGTPTLRALALSMALMTLPAGCVSHADPSPSTAIASKGPHVAPMPTTPEEARDGVISYSQRTLRELPEGFTLDGTRYGGGGDVGPCDDTHGDPVNYSEVRDLRTPPGTDYNALISKVGEIWRGWGWRVVERDGFDKPNRFGYSPNGYWLSIEAAGAYFPSFTGASPCFIGGEDRYHYLRVPKTITRDQLIYADPSTAPTR